MKKAFVTIIEGRNKVEIEKLLPEYMVKLNGKKVGKYGTFQLAERKAMRIIKKVI